MWTVKFVCVAVALRSSKRALDMLAEAMLPGPGRVYALVITGCSIETNLEMRGKYPEAQGPLKKELAEAAERCRKAGRPVPDVRLLSVKSRVFNAACEAIFGASGRTGEGLGDHQRDVG